MSIDTWLSPAHHFPHPSAYLFEAIIKYDSFLAFCQLIIHYLLLIATTTEMNINI